MSIDIKNIDVLLPNIKGLVDQKVELEIYRAFRRVYEFFAQESRKQDEEFNRKLSDKLSSTQEQTSTLLNGFATQLIGIQNAVNPLATLGGGTVVSISFNNAFIGGTITQSGVVSLIIGSNNTIQKSDGTKLVDSRIVDIAGGDMSLNSTKKIFLGITPTVTIDDSSGLIIINMALLPAVDPGVSGALWNNAGVINVSP